MTQPKSYYQQGYEMGYLNERLVMSGLIERFKPAGTPREFIRGFYAGRVKAKQEGPDAPQPSAA